VDDAAITRLNGRHRGVIRRTDVLAFPLEAPGVATPLVGQVVISAETARRQAHRLGVPLGVELDLLVTHGVLHLVGYDDRDPVEAGLMHERERAILSTGRRRPPARLWQGLLDAQPLHPGVKRPSRSRVASVSGHPRPEPASRPPLQRSRVASVPGHPRPEPASRPPLQ
jgi:rRNA maturation RNase YbeY